MQDLRDALRALRAAPIVSAVAVLSLALGIGANTAIFSIVNSLMLRQLPVEEPERLALVDKGSWTYPIWDQIRQRPQTFEHAFAWSSTRFNLAEGGITEFADGIWASGGIFDTLGVGAVLGRTFADADDRRGGGPDGAVAVISYSFWQRRFGGAADAIGRRLVVERVPCTIVGVMPPDFFGPDIGRTFDVIVPIGVEPLVRGKETSLDRRSTWWLNIMIRLEPGQSLESAQAALRGVQPQIREATIPENWRPQDLAGYLKEPFTLKMAAGSLSPLRVRYERPLLTIMIVVALVLLIACANRRSACGGPLQPALPGAAACGRANLLLSRATARRHEFSVRLALGAGRLRLARQLLAESLLLAASGAVIGLLFARWTSRLLVAQLSTPTNNVYLDLTLDWRVLGFTVGAGLLTALVFGTAPAFRASRSQPIDALKEQGRGTAGDTRIGVTSVLVVAQVALSLAKKFLNGGNPIGRTVKIPGQPLVVREHQIVGLVADAVYRSVREPIPPTAYLAIAQYENPSFPLSGMSLSVRSSGAGSPALLTRSVAATIQAIDRDLALTFRPLAVQVNASLNQERIVALLSGFFGALALLLAGLGLYGVTSYAMSRRRTEIGIRLALGASPGSVVRQVLSRVVVLVALGMLAGLGASVWASRFVATLLYGLEPRDPVTLAGAAIVLTAIGAIAGWVPARRASRLDPAKVLREA